MLASFIAWVAVLGLIALGLLHLRLRAAIARLSGELKEPDHDDERKRFDPQTRVFTPESVRELGKEIDRHLDERTERIEQQTQQQRLIEAILDQFSDGFLIVRKDLRIAFANRVARKHFAQKRKITGMTVIQAFLDHRMAAVIEEALKKKETHREEIRLDERLEQDGETMERFVVIEAGRLPFPMQGVDGVWVILRDESQRHHLEQIRRDFVANASHELRTPLSIITGYLENLTDGDVTDPEMMQRFLGIMNKHAIRLGRIVEDMLMISKLEGSAELIRQEPFDLLESAADMVEHLHPVIADKNANVVIDMPEDRSIIGDRYYWDQIFFNLIENALKQNDRKGLEIDVRLRPNGKADRLLLEISDNGVGIPSADLPHVFKRFYRVEKHHSQEIKGTGLGLSIVKRAIEAHGGTISVQSQPGIHTTFAISIPKGTSNSEN